MRFVQLAVLYLILGRDILCIAWGGSVVSMKVYKGEITFRQITSVAMANAQVQVNFHENGRGGHYLLHTVKSTNSVVMRNLTLYVCLIILFVMKFLNFIFLFLLYTKLY